MNDKQTVLITGGTGMIGKALTKILFEKNYEVIILTRDPEKNRVSDKSLSYAKWDIEQEFIDAEALKKADYIVHLAGANVGEKRWTKKRKKEIVDSRVKSGQLLVKALSENQNKVKAVVSASAIGWYGPDKFSKHEQFDEADPAYTDFLSKTCVQWENSIEPIAQLNKRLVKLRTGIVLSNEAGAYPEFKKPLKFGVATILGSGRQVISWIHIDDLVRIYISAIENEKINGTYNAVAPQPVTNKKLTLELAKTIRNSTFIPIHVPAFALKIVLGEMSIEVLKSATVSCRKIQQHGFTFLYPSIEAAINQLK
ncbi:MAG: TIGR01777 family oxidoreductase [Chitinophagaceae bacterium]